MHDHHASKIYHLCALLKSAMALVKGQTGAVPENMSKTLGLMRQCCEDSGLTVALYLTSRLIHFSEGDRPLAASAHLNS